MNVFEDWAREGGGEEKLLGFRVYQREEKRIGALVR